jgi:hypothetical protein
MSFLRHREIYPPMGARLGRAPAHRRDEFPAGYSLAGCSPAEPASALPAKLSVRGPIPRDNNFSTNGDMSLIALSQPRGPVHPDSQTSLGSTPKTGDTPTPRPV